MCTMVSSSFAERSSRIITLFCAVVLLVLLLFNWCVSSSYSGVESALSLALLLLWLTNTVIGVCCCSIVTIIVNDDSFVHRILLLS